jgi:hypothetical protein
LRNACVAFRNARGESIHGLNNRRRNAIATVRDLCLQAGDPRSEFAGLIN